MVAYRICLNSPDLHLYIWKRVIICGMMRDMRMYKRSIAVRERNGHGKGLAPLLPGLVPQSLKKLFISGFGTHRFIGSPNLRPDEFGLVDSLRPALQQWHRALPSLNRKQHNFSSEPLCHLSMLIQNLQQTPTARKANLTTSNPWPGSHALYTSW